MSFNLKRVELVPWSPTMIPGRDYRSAEVRDGLPYDAETGTYLPVGSLGVMIDKRPEIPVFRGVGTYRSSKNSSDEKPVELSAESKRFLEMDSLPIEKKVEFVERADANDPVARRIAAEMYDTFSIGEDGNVYDLVCSTYFKVEHPDVVRTYKKFFARG